MWRKCIDKYDVSWAGEIRNRVTGRVLKAKKNKSGYSYCTISVAGKLKDLQVHREVARCFCVKHPGRDQVNHKDGIKSNNLWSNLEWVTPQENMQHAVRTGLVDRSKFNRPVTVMTSMGEEIFAKSISAAAALAGCSPGEVYKCCTGQRKTARGFAYRFSGSVG